MNKKAFINYYLLLNIPAYSSPEECKKAYFRLVKLYHPDTNKGNRIAEKKFQQLNQAWQVLKDPAKKSLFDQQLSQWEAKQRLSSKKLQPIEEKGLDLEYPLKVSLEDICQRRTKSIQYLRPIYKGQEKHSFDFQLPAGVKQGSRLYFKGQGGAKGHKKFGDLYVLISVRPHKLFKPIESSFDLMIQHPISFTSAFRGEKIEIPSPYGFLSLELKKPLKEGELLKLKNQGLFKNKAGDKGDLFVKISIDYPLELGLKAKTLMDRLSDKEKALYIQKMKKKTWIFPKVLKYQKKIQEIKRKQESL